jgi:hypothetical protein
MSVGFLGSFVGHSTDFAYPSFKLGAAIAGRAHRHFSDLQFQQFAQKQFNARLLLTVGSKPEFHRFPSILFCNAFKDSMVTTSRPPYWMRRLERVPSQSRRGRLP